MNDFEDNRKSLSRALIKGDFERAKEKIEDNLQLLNLNIKELQSYLFKMGSSKDNKALIENK